MNKIDKVKEILEQNYFSLHITDVWENERKPNVTYIEYIAQQICQLFPEPLDKPKLPATLTNNIGCMSKEAIENFADMVLRECGYPYAMKMKWTTAGDIMIKPFIYIDKRHINEYPYTVKERVLHEVAHIDTHPQDDRHGEIFHSRLAELIEQFMGRSSRQISDLEQEDEVDPRQVVGHGGEVDDSKLTDEEIVRAIHGFSIQGYQGDLITERDRRIVKAQDAKAASRMRAKFQTAFTEEIK